MRGGDDVAHREQAIGHLGLMLEHVETGAGDLAFLQGARECRLVDNRPARGVDEKGRGLHQRELALADLMMGLRFERRMHRDEVGLP